MICLIKLRCVQVLTGLISCILKSEDNFAYQFSLSTLFETGSLVHHCVVQAGPWTVVPPPVVQASPWASGEPPVFTSHLLPSHCRLTEPHGHAIVYGFTWVLGIQTLVPTLQWAMHQSEHFLNRGYRLDEDNPSTTHPSFFLLKFIIIVCMCAYLHACLCTMQMQ